MLERLYIHSAAAASGFDLCGVAAVRPLPDNERFFRRWLAAGRHASLGYLERNVDKRFDARRLVEGARTAVVCAVGYKNALSDGYPEGFRAKIASYALAADYHTTLKAMLGDLFERLRAAEPALTGRAFVDTAPLAEKQLAVEAGLGWIGRQSLLVTPQYGSFVLLGELVLDAACDACDRPLAGAGCGACRRCIDACPAGAVCEDRAIDARRCISCRTIERPAAGCGPAAGSGHAAGTGPAAGSGSTVGTGQALGSGPAAGFGLAPQFEGWIFGCDGCQSCCPYNRRAPQHRHPAFDALFDPLSYPPERWMAMQEEEFRATFGRTPLVRSGLARLQAHAALNLRRGEG